MHRSTEQLVGRLTEAVADLSEWPIPEEDTPDVVGTIKQVVRQLDTANPRWTEYPGLKQRLIEEMDPQAEGDLFRAVESRQAKRSFNTDRLLASFTAVFDKDLAVAIRRLVAAGALKLEGNHSKLRDVAAEWDMPLLVAYHEVMDGDPEFHLGEVWGSRVDVQPK